MFWNLYIKRVKWELYAHLQELQGFEKLLVQKLCELSLSQIMEKHLEGGREVMRDSVKHVAIC